MNLAALEALLPYATVLALASDPRGITSTSNVHVSDVPRVDSQTSPEARWEHVATEPGPPAFGGAGVREVYELTIQRTASSSKADLQAWAKQVGRYFHGQHRPAGVPGLRRALVDEPVAYEGSEPGSARWVRMSVTFEGRRTSNPLWWPGSDADALWYDANDLANITKDSSDVVSAWAPRVGTGPTLAATGSPTWKGAGAGAAPAIQLNGTDLLQSDSWATSGMDSGEVTCFVALDLPAVSGSSLVPVQMTNSGGTRLRLVSLPDIGGGNGWRIHDYDGTTNVFTDSGANPSPGRFVLTAVWDPTASRYLRVNGSQVLAPSGSVNADGMTRMNLLASSAEMRVAGLLFLPRAATAADLSNFEGYLADLIGARV